MRDSHLTVVCGALSTEQRSDFDVIWAGHLRAGGKAGPGAGARTGAGDSQGVRDVAGGSDHGQPAQDDDENVRRRRQEKGAQIVS